MKDIVVYIHVSAYMAEWLRHSFGDPVRLPRRSYENILLSSLLQKKSRAKHNPITDDKALPVVIPNRSDHRPEYYNHLSQAGEQRFVRALKDIFKLHLWSDIFPLVYSHERLNESIDKWCREHGISLDNREAVRQCFFRLRQNHEQYGIVLGKKYVKSLPI